MQTIIFASGSGGCGRTTLALSVARELSRAGHGVLVAEGCGGFGCAADILGLAGQTAFSLSDILEGRCGAEQAVLLHRCGLGLISAPADYRYIPGQEALLALLPRIAAMGNEFMFFDCAAGFSPAQENIASVCDAALLVSTPDFVSARGAGAVNAALAAAGVAKRRLVINRVGAAVSKSSGVADLDEVIDLAGAQLIGVVPEQRDARRGILDGEAASKAVHNVAGRLLDKNIPLLPLFL